MVGQVAPLFKTFPTKFAMKGPFSCVHFHVIAQHALATHVFTTYQTVKVPLGLMRDEVALKQISLSENMIAYMAAVKINV